MTLPFTPSTVVSKCTCFAVPLAARQVDQVQLALLERGVTRLAVRVDALNLQREKISHRSLIG